MMALAASLVVIVYFSIQYWVIKSADQQTEAKSNSSRPLLYSLSLAASGSSWMYYGSTSYAAKHGIEFAGLYVGIVLVFTLGFPLLRKIVQLAKSEGIRSISDFIGARYGKSFTVAALVTVITTIGLIPYISLQMTAIHYLIDVFSGVFDPNDILDEHRLHLFIVAVEIGIGLFTVFYCARSPHFKERYEGLIHALAVDSVIKFTGFVLVGIAAVTFLFGSPTEIFTRLIVKQPDIPALQQGMSAGNFFGLILIGASSVLLLPNQFYLTIVQNRGASELGMARWFVPLFLLIIGIFVLPISAIGSMVLPAQASADFYFLSLPLAAGRHWLAIVAFAGGISAATTMIIAPSILLSVMISNDLILPVLLRRANINSPEIAKDFTKIIPNLRRAALIGILIAAFAYQFVVSVRVDFAVMALISAIAMMQLLPPLLGGLFWRRGTARGAIWGMLAGFCVWAYTMVLPTMLDSGSSIVVDGPFGLAALRPHALFGLEASNYINSLFWSLSVNIALFIAGSLSRSATPLERIQASIFIADAALSMNAVGSLQPSVTVDQLKMTISKYIGNEQTDLAFKSFHKQENIALEGSDAADFKTVHFAEQLLSGIVGSPSARMILSLAMGPTGPAQRRAQILLDHATDALAQNRHLLQTALDQMDQGISVFDRQYRLSCWNTQFRLILDLPKELQRMGTPLNRILSYLYERDDLADFTNKTFTEQFTDISAPWRIKLKGTGQTIEIRSNSIPDGGLVTTFTDVTNAVNADNLLRQTNESLELRVRDRTAELTLANQQLGKAQRRAEEANLGKTRFLADAGHDILQPLNAARLYSSSLMEQLGNSREKELASNVDSSLEAVESIISALLDISRLDTGALKPVISVFRLDALLQQIARDFAPTAREKGLDLRIVASSAVIATDRNLLRRLIQNLVSNAIKYCRSGKILVGVRRRGKSIELQILDTGIGIPTGKLDHIFREFSRLPEGMKESDGLGLGLSIVERIAKILDLSIIVTSRVGKGSVFSVTMVASNVPVLPTIEATQTVKPFSVLTGLKVLCVDDNERSLAGMQELLTTWGCQVLPFKSGKTLLAYCVENPVAIPAVILADYNLDEENGLDVIQNIREHLQRHLKAALITADRSNHVRERALLEDISIINKPVRPAILRALLSHFSQAIAAE
ncbi:hybrid sensor histidine kinase/response regulator [Phyllobacterium chamaecytisi]|uniref:hybrid sensor histidine kinase/response regulator n=1 Tax=Phyllobacterium chamaecytisi TaxID=2876082 RepID=UPI001CC99E8A|nr:PAS domain-containing hybrid sensor histidine kinase/response regulator [Phyllobacterium sp. KW56]MBZ9605628.1 PAS domain-containing hybrid sensor histidine kinase/response regulator [Phyllobacterium sp. KW56]